MILHQKYLSFAQLWMSVFLQMHHRGRVPAFTVHNDYIILTKAD